ncbi:Zinc finger protein 84 [Araneus ventricosus]|uniref:Zinc finger protein 84 n=1 Tax=Araneus ventricosus TaxID=182803 RepID=A0A4Y2J7G0_ARAVE|nr:Zinc finger protein 84 [Araneus ventricosus]GBO20104.1 Zinc finger protein 84 [Araneus ventricosus]
MENNKIKSISDKFTRVDDSSSGEIATHSLPLFSLADAEVVSVAGPSGIHTQSHRSGKGKRFVCDECGKAFGENSNLKVHYRKHTGEKPSVCPRCDKKFRRKHHLNDYLRTHTGEKPFACHICSKAFAHKSSLACHLRTHTGEKPYKCKLCDMDFADKGNCNEHYKRMHGGK